MEIGNERKVWIIISRVVVAVVVFSPELRPAGSGGGGKIINSVPLLFSISFASFSSKARLFYSIPSKMFTNQPETT